MEMAPSSIVILTRGRPAHRPGLASAGERQSTDVARGRPKRRRRRRQRRRANANVIYIISRSPRFSRLSGELEELLARLEAGEQTGRARRRLSTRATCGGGHNGSNPVQASRAKLSLRAPALPTDPRRSFLCNSVSVRPLGPGDSGAAIDSAERKPPSSRPARADTSRRASTVEPPPRRFPDEVVGLFAQLAASMYLILLLSTSSRSRPERLLDLERTLPTTMGLDHARPEGPFPGIEICPPLAQGLD